MIVRDVQMDLSTGPEVIEEDVHALGVDAIILYDDARAANDFASITLLVDLAKASPRSYDRWREV